MRDILTALAFLAILVLSAALIAPPFIDWEGRRAEVDAAMTRASGAPVETRGAIDVRLLPTPRLRVDGVTIGRPDSDEPSLDASGVVAEIELTTLLRGEVRFRRINLDSAELRAPTLSGALRPPSVNDRSGDLVSALALDDLSIRTLTITALSPDFGARRVAVLDDVAVSSPSLLGPWRIEARYAGEIVRMATGRPGPDGAVPVKIVAGSEADIRYDIDGFLSFAQGPHGYLPRLAGQARIDVAASPAGDGAPAAPAVIRTHFESDAVGFALRELVIEPGDPGLGSPLEGEGFLRVDDPRLQVSLSGRRLALDAILRSPIGARLAGLHDGAPDAGPPPVEFSLTLGSVGYGLDELLDARVRGVLEAGALSIFESGLTLPGESRASFAGEVELGEAGEIAGAARLTSSDPSRLRRFLTGVLGETPWLAVIDGQALDVAGEVAYSPGGFTIRDLAYAAGDARIGGEITYSAPVAGLRGGVAARITADAIDVAALPRFDAFMGVGGANDVSLSVEANAVRFEGGEDAGRIVARLSSDGTSVVLDALELSDLAGASATVSGRISEDGSGLIAGRITAARAAPLLALLERFQPDAPFAMAPAFVREGALDLSVAIERVPAGPGLDAPALRTSLEGTVAGGPFAARATTIGGRSEDFTLTLATADTRSWLDVEHPLIAGRPSEFRVEMRRAGTDRFAATLVGDLAGLRLRSTRPISIDAASRALRDGEITLSSSDVRPAFALLGLGSGGSEPTSVDLRASLASEEDGSRVSVSGSLAGVPMTGALTLPAVGDAWGTITAGSVSMPALLDVLVFATDASEAGGRWSDDAFGPVSPPLARGAVALSSPSIDFGKGLVLRDATVDIALLPDGLVLRDVSGALEDGSVAGEATLRRSSDGTVAIVGKVDFADLPSEALAPGAPITGRLTGSIDFGASGGSVVALVGDLAGGGAVAIDDPRVAALDGSGLARGIERALTEDDPLGGRRLQAIVEEEVARADLAPAPFSAAVTLVGGALRFDPLRFESDDAAWSGAATFELLNGSLDARGLLQAKRAPAGWTGAAPAIALGWTGGVDEPHRDIDVGPLTSGVAQIVLQRELDRIEAFEREANERARRIEALRMEQARAADAERWVEELRLREEERLRLEAEEAERNAAEEAARLAAEEEARIAAEEQARRDAEDAAARAAEEEARRLADDEAGRAAEEAERLRAQEEFERVMETEREAIRRLLEEAPINETPTGPSLPGDESPEPLMILPPGFAPN